MTNEEMLNGMREHLEQSRATLFKAGRDKNNAWLKGAKHALAMWHESLTRVGEYLLAHPERGEDPTEKVVETLYQDEPSQPEEETL